MSTKCLLNIKTIVTQNLTNNSRKLAPLPLKTEKDSSFETKLSISYEKDISIGQKSQDSQILSPKKPDFNRISQKTEHSTHIPPLPLNRSVHANNSKVLSSYKKPPIHRIDSASPTISTLDDEDDEEDCKSNSPLIFVNRSLTFSNEQAKKPIQYSRKSMPHHPTNYMRHQISPSMNTNNSSQSRRSFPRFESVRTPVELVDCCQPKSTNRSSNFYDGAKVREIMLQASQRLTKDLDSLTPLPIVDTHCHFDLIFDRLRIKHNNLTRYFNECSEYYPPGFSFQLAIQVFWRPEQLTEDQWTNWYSKYLNDDRVYGSCGIHPHWSSAWNETSIDDIERCLQHPKVVAIGEIGLDFGPKNMCLIHEQRRAFEGQLKLAAQWSKPIVIHSRNAYEETFILMKQYLDRNHKIHLHCFVGTYDDVQMFTSYFTEIKFGFTPIITKSKFLHSVIEQIQLTQILSETDSPYFIPDELSSYTRCAHPGMIYSVIETIAELRHMPVYDVACQLRENARDIYGI